MLVHQRVHHFLSDIPTAPPFFCDQPFTFSGAAGLDLRASGECIGNLSCFEVCLTGDLCYDIPKVRKTYLVGG